MKFWADAGGGGFALDADDADEAAEKAAEKEYDGGDPQEEFDVTVLAPDGTVTRHEVHVEYSPSFYAHEHDKEPDASTVEELRGYAAKDWA